MIVKTFLLFIIYFVTAKLGLKMDAVSGFATLVWPPAGIALAALLLYGYRLWPGIFLGAFLINFLTGAPFLVAFGIGMGNTLEAVVGAYLLIRVADFHKPIDRLRDVVSLVVFAAAFSTLISATIGVASLWLGSVKSLEGIGVTWRAWWVGDALGDLIVTPLILVWATMRFRLEKIDLWALLEAGLLGASLLTAGIIVFDGVSGHVFWFIPFVVWAALRFGQVGNISTAFVISVMAIWGTAYDLGPFAHGPLRDNLFLLHSFMVIISITGMTLAASLAERKFAVQATKEEEMQKSAILMASMDGIVSMNDEGKIREFNLAAEKIFGYRRSEVLGKEMAEVIIPSRLREAHRKGLARYLVSGKEKVMDRRVEFPAVRKDGSEFPVELTITRMHLKGSPMFTGFIRDITEQVRLLSSEDRSKKRLILQYRVMTILAETNALQEGVNKVLQVIGQDMDWDFGAFWIIDEKAQVLKSADIWHTPQVNTPEFIQATATWEFSKGTGLPGRIWRDRKPAWIENVIKDGNFPRCAVADKEGLHGAFGFPILNGENVLGVMEFFSREIRMPDDELLKTVETIGGQIGQYMNRLSAEESLRQAIRARDEFLSIASHELKTPITSLKLQLQMTQRTIHPEKNIVPPPSKLLQIFNISTRQILRVEGLVEDLLDVAKIRSGKLAFRQEEVNLASLMREVIERLEEQLKESNSEVIVDLDEKTNGFWDRGRIEQVVTNLISNAIKYAPGKPIEILVSQIDDDAYLVVKDHGQGIELEKQSVIFERFERAQSSQSIAGLGLGLFIVKQIVEGHRGSIQVESEVGKGSKFTVKLPLKPVIDTQESHIASGVSDQATLRKEINS